MASYNNSSTKYTFGKNPGDEWVKLKINNIGDDTRTFKVRAYDIESNEDLQLFSEDKEIHEQTIEPNSFTTIKIDAAKAKNKIALELSHNGRSAGISMRQHSSSNKENEDGIVLNLK